MTELSGPYPSECLECIDTVIDCSLHVIHDIVCGTSDHYSCDGTLFFLWKQTNHTQISKTFHRPPDKSLLENYFFLFLNQSICCGYSRAHRPALGAFLWDIDGKIVWIPQCRALGKTLQHVSWLEKNAISKRSDKPLHDLRSLVGALAICTYTHSPLSGDLHLHNMGLISRKSVFGFANRPNSKVPAQLQGLARMVNFCMHQGKLLHFQENE